MYLNYVYIIISSCVLKWYYNMEGEGHIDNYIKPLKVQQNKVVRICLNKHSL